MTRTINQVVRVPSAVLVTFFAVAGAAGAQGLSLEGRVLDPDRAAIAGAPVILASVSSGETRTIDSGADGTFQFTGLAPGPYRIQIVAAGFSVYTQEIALDAVSRALDAMLEIAPVREDITVLGAVPTIGRVNTPLRDQPLTVNTLPTEYLEAHALNDVVTALKHVPNVQAYNQYGVYQYFTFRGFSESVQLVDGIRNEGNRVNTQLANVERIEVLKGPASVLYGGDAIGGTVNLVLKKPSAQPTFDFAAAAGRWDTYRGSLGAGGRVGQRDNLFYRFDLGAESATNFRHDPWKRLNLTPSLQWQASSAGRLDVRYMFDRNRVSGDSGIPLVPLEGGFVPDPTRTAIGDPLARAVRGDGSDAIPKVPQDTRYNTPDDFGLGTDQNFRVSYAQMLGQSIAFSNTVGYRHFNDEYWVAEFLDVTPPSQVNRGFLYFFHHGRPLMNQAELSGRFHLGVEHDFLVGWDFQHYRRYTDRRAGASFDTTPIDLFDPVETHVRANASDFPISRIDYRTDRANGIFFQDTLTVLPNLSVVLGGRFDRVRRRNHNNPVVDGVETEGMLNRGESDEFTYRAGLVYQPVGVLDVYAQNATSFSPNFTVQADGTPLDPEYGEMYEVGQRLWLAQERLHFSTALYQIEKRNLARNLGGGIYDLIGKLRSRGFEAELQGRVTPSWYVNAGYGLTSATFLDYVSRGGADLSGNRPRRSPEHTVNFSTWYTWANGLTLMVGGRTVSDLFLNDSNTVAFNGYELLDFGASYTRGRVQYSLNFTNVTDTQYWASSLGDRQLYPGQPFNALASVRIRTN